jgi:hypothetical protein
MRGPPSFADALFTGIADRDTSGKALTPACRVTGSQMIAMAVWEPTVTREGGRGPA